MPTALEKIQKHEHLAKQSSILAVRERENERNMHGFLFEEKVE